MESQLITNTAKALYPAEYHKEGFSNIYIHRLIPILYLKAPLNKHDVNSPGTPGYFPNLWMMKYGKTLKETSAQLQLPIGQTKTSHT